MKRKVLKSLIALALTVSMLAGCAQSAVTSGENASGGTSATSQSQNVSSYADSKAESSVTSTASTTAAESTPKSTESSTDTTKASENKPSQIAGKMRNITSQQLVEDMTFGWNLGNTLDVCQADRDGDGKINEHVEAGEKVDETLWGNPKATKELFTSLKKNGVNAVRIPVTWRDHMDSNGNIDREWMDRVQQVVDYAYSQGMYVIINVHHDGGGDPKFGAWIIEESQKDYNTFLKKYKNVWKQIAERFKNYSDYLIFESMNEVGFDTLYNKNKADAYNLINKINQDFVDIIRATGGNNAKRHLLIAGYYTDIERTCDSLYKMPDDKAGRCILSVHYYTPWDFCTCDIKHTWGTKSEVRQMETLIGKMKKNFVDKGIPVIIGEYAASGSDLSSCIFFIEKLNKLCSDYGIATFIWDSGRQVNRKTYKWRTPQYLEALKRATSGKDYEVVKE
ncbi:endoglucanase [[Eubacterium] siraeum CAG:80]|uniref:Endoglucanase n=1 Tax=[Eubacterium] siraeum CAG:80 TaxID=1263080 RepID=R6RTN7_9FIRM|nr:endoglucanase [[Eubacterium] siraeum CAG:80]